MKARQWDHDQLAHDLANKFRADPAMMVWENMPMGPAGSQRPDVYVLPKSYARFTPMTYEVKVSVADFRSDVTAGKWQGYLKYSAGVVFAAPAGLISKDEVPAGCGLILRHDEVWRTVKKPTLQRVESLPHEVWMKMMIDGIERASQERYRQRPSGNVWATEARLRQKHGEAIANLVARAYRSAEDVEEAIKNSEKRRLEIISGASKFEQEHRERLERNQGWLNQELRQLAMALGMPADSTVTQLTGGVRQAVHRLTNDAELQRLRRHIDTIKRAVETASEPLPGESEVQKALPGQMELAGAWGPAQ